MANNEYVNKVVYDGRTLIDITDTDFDETKLPLGSVAYAASGARVVGSAIVHNVYTDTTAGWNAKSGYIPDDGDVIVYTDKSGNVPGVKIGDGESYCSDLPFIGDDVENKVRELKREAPQFSLCTSSSVDFSKDVSVYDIPSDNYLVEGYSIIVQMMYAQDYNGIPELHFSSIDSKTEVTIFTTAAPIYRKYGVPAERNEWGAGDVLILTRGVTYSEEQDSEIPCWYIVNGTGNYMGNNVANVYEVMAYLRIR